MKKRLRREIQRHIAPFSSLIPHPSSLIIIMRDFVLTFPELMLDWGLGATSLFNTIILLWLGFTVLLNAEKRAWGTMLAGTGMLLGGVFFLVHTATLDYTWEALYSNIRSWWYLCWACVLALPLGWYVLMLWYAGFWTQKQTRAALKTAPSLRRHWAGLFLATCLGALMATLIVIADPARIFAQVAYREANPLAFHGIPLLLAACPLYLLACLLLSLDALGNTGKTWHPANKALDDVARRRARPWLMASTGVQLISSLCVAALLVWVLWKVHVFQVSYTLFTRVAMAVMVADLVISSLVGVAVVLMGKAVVSYEIFTGKTLPRRGFLRQWRNIVAVAMAYSILVSLCWAAPMRPVYPLLLTTVLMSVFFALFSWRGYAERENYVAQLRPFVASQGLYEQLLDSENAHEKIDAASPFRALCGDILGVEAAYLVAVGPLAPLVGAPLVFPPERRVSAPPLDEILPQLSPKTMCIALDPAQSGGIVWAVPLWSERGLIGVLLLGEKRDGGLYTQEEIEIARASGERLIDTQASAALAGRLMSLQRQRLAQNMMLDRRARRVLHDDVLPRLHAIMLTFQNAPPEALAQLGEAHHEISNLLREMPGATTPEVARLGLVEALKQAAHDEHNADFDAVVFEVEENAQSLARALPPLAQETLFYAAREAVRNAARHARPAEEEKTALQMHIRFQARDGLQLTIEDNGVGIENAAPHSHAGGSGQGLSLHGAMMAILGGTLSLESRPEGGTRVLLHLPQAALAPQLPTGQ